MNRSRTFGMVPKKPCATEYVIVYHIFPHRIVTNEYEKWRVLDFPTCDQISQYRARLIHMVPGTGDMGCQDGEIIRRVSCNVAWVRHRMELLSHTATG